MSYKIIKFLLLCGTIFWGIVMVYGGLRTYAEWNKPDFVYALLSLIIVAVIFGLCLKAWLS